jgi:hypothetical protein
LNENLAILNSGKERNDLTRIAGDSTTLTDIPLHVDIAMSYINGSYAVTRRQLLTRFPHEYYGHAFIDVDGSRPDVSIRDWETGDKSGSLEQWVIDHNKHSDKSDAVVYCNVSTIPEVRADTGSQILGKDYYLFVATLDGTAYTGSGVIACQRDGEQKTGGHWDRSLVYDNRFWQKVGAPVPKARPNCRMLQAAVRAKVDDSWGSNTDTHCGALRDAATMSRFPYGVTFAQRVVGTTPDGIWGPNSETMLRETVISVQNALAHMGFDPKGSDGIWGPDTEDAYEAARHACHI